MLRDGDEALALVMPIDSRSIARRRVLTASDRQAFRDSAGSWKGHIDADKFLADNAESRRMPPRPSPRREKTEADYASFRSAAGSRKGTIDADQFIKDNNESRRIDTRPPVDR